MTEEDTTDGRTEPDRGTETASHRDDETPDASADTVTPTGDADTVTPDGGADTANPIREAATSGESRTKSLLLWVTLVVLSVLAVVALLQFYLNASAAINRWIAPEYRRIMQAVFNLVVLLVSGIGIAMVVRELSE